MRETLTLLRVSAPCPDGIAAKQLKSVVSAILLPLCITFQQLLIQKNILVRGNRQLYGQFIRKKGIKPIQQLLTRKHVPFSWQTPRNYCQQAAE